MNGTTLPSVRYDMRSRTWWMVLVGNHYTCNSCNKCIVIIVILTIAMRCDNWSSNKRMNGTTLQSTVRQPAPHSPSISYDMRSTRWWMVQRSPVLLSFTALKMLFFLGASSRTQFALVSCNCLSIRFSFQFPASEIWLFKHKSALAADVADCFSSVKLWVEWNRRFINS